MTRILTEADSLADLNGTPRPGDLPPLPNAFATLHHDDGYFTMPSRNESIRRPFRTNAYSADQMTTYGQACAAQAAARVVELEAELADTDQMNEQLREQNTMLDQACANYEQEFERLKRDAELVK